MSGCWNPNAFDLFSFGNIFDSNLTDDIKGNVNKFVKSTNKNVENTVKNSNDINNLLKKMMNNWFSNINNSFESNVSLAQDMLKCHNFNDVLDLNNRIFNTNFNNLKKMYEGYFSDYYKIINFNMKNSSECFDNNIKSFKC